MAYNFIIVGLIVQLTERTNVFNVSTTVLFFFCFFGISSVIILVLVSKTRSCSMIKKSDYSQSDVSDNLLPILC